MEHYRNCRTSSFLNPTFEFPSLRLTHQSQLSRSYLANPDRYYRPILRTPIGTVDPSCQPRSSRSEFTICSYCKFRFLPPTQRRRLLCPDSTLPSSPTWWNSNKLATHPVSGFSTQALNSHPCVCPSLMTHQWWVICEESSVKSHLWWVICDESSVIIYLWWVIFEFPSVSADPSVSAFPILPCELRSLLLN